MKKIIAFLLLSMLALPLLFACEDAGEVSETVSKEVSKEEPEVVVADAPLPVFHTEYNVNGEILPFKAEVAFMTDRLPYSLESLYELLQEHNENNVPAAICLITLEEFDFSEISDKDSTVPFTFTIEEVYAETSSFPNVAGESLTGSEPFMAIWRTEKDVDGNTFLHFLGSDADFHMTQSGFKYIAYIQVEERWDFSLKSLTPALTEGKLTEAYFKACREYYPFDRQFAESVIIKLLGENHVSDDILEKHKGYDFEKLVFSQKPLADLTADQIESATVELFPSDVTAEIKDLETLAELLNDIVICMQDDTWGTYDGGFCNFNIKFKDGTELKALTNNSFFVIDGVGYVAMYTPCETLSDFAYSQARNATEKG